MKKMLEKLDKDMISAMKNHQKEELAVIREIKAGMKQAHIDQKRELDEELLIEVVSRGVKTRKESIKEFEKGNRQDLVDKTLGEIEILNRYLPEQLTKEELEQLIDQVFSEVNPTSNKDMGKIMGKLTPLVKGKTDMKEVSGIIQEKLKQL